MPSAFAHAAPALALIPAFSRPGMSKRLWVLGVCCAAAPDLDVVGHALGVPYAHPMGHRGLSHSIPFAALLAYLVASFALSPARDGVARGRAWLYLFLATASHGLFDACTNGGMGIALLSPFDLTRYRAPFRPIHVSPLSISAFFSTRGLTIVESELLWVWLPCAALAVVLLAWRRAVAPARGRGERRVLA